MPPLTPPTSDDALTSENSPLRGIVSCLADPLAYSDACARAETCLASTGFEKDIKTLVAESTRILIARELMTTHLPDIDALRALIDQLVATDTWTRLEARSLPLDAMGRAQMPVLATYLGAVEEILAQARREGATLCIGDVIPHGYRALVGTTRERTVGGGGGLQMVRERVAGIVRG